MRAIGWILSALVAALVALGAPPASAAGVAPDSLLICSSGGRWTPLIAPVRCDAQPRGTGLAMLARLASIRWSSWGGSSARATARDLGTRSYDRPRRVVLRAFRRRSYCGTADYAYTRLRITWQGGSRTLRLPSCEI